MNFTFYSLKFSEPAFKSNMKISNNLRAYIKSSSNLHYFIKEHRKLGITLINPPDFTCDPNYLFNLFESLDDPDAFYMRLKLFGIEEFESFNYLSLSSLSLK